MKIAYIYNKQMIDYIQAIILGIVEGITEFLPISSTAHLILTAKILNLSQTEFLKSFQIIIQLGAILAVVYLYWRSFLKWEIIKRLAVAFLPTGILGLVFYNLVKHYFIGNVGLVLWSLFLGGIFLIIFEKKHRENANSADEIDKITLGQCFVIGTFQSISMIPGISRSAATIIGGLAIGLKRKAIVEFSFLLAVPTMFLATGLDLVKNADNFSRPEAHLLFIGFFTSFVMAILGIKFLLKIIRKRSFIFFGIYRIALASGFYLWMLA